MKKRKIRKLAMLAGSLLLVALLTIGFAAPAQAQMWFSVVTGDVTIDGGPAVVDTVIDAYVGAEVAPRATTTVTTAGVYSILIVGGPADAGAVLSFKVDELDATETPPAPVFQLAAQVVDLAAFTGPPPTRYTLTVTINPAGGGTVTGAGINCPGDCTEDYNEGTLVQLTAVAAFDYAFFQWSGDLTGSASTTTLMMTEDKNVTANFIGAAEFTVTLPGGWSLLSTPVLLDAGSDSLGQIFDAESLDNIAIFYSWNGEMFVEALDDYELLPLDAIFVNVMSGASAVAEFFPSQELSGPPSRGLQTGLNLFGPAPALESVPQVMPLDQALVSIAQAPGGIGYTMVISPAYNQPGWTYALGSGVRDLLPYKGYWVVMDNGDTLYGFSTTPIPE